MPYEYVPGIRQHSGQADAGKASRFRTGRPAVAGYLHIE